MGSIHNTHPLNWASMNTELFPKAVRIGLAIFLLGSAVGCVTGPYTVRTFSSDDDNKKTIKRMVGNSLGGPTFAYIALDVQRSEGIDGEMSYDLVVTYWTEEKFHHIECPLFLESGETLILFIDGNRVGLSGEGSGQNRTHDRYAIHERAYYAASPDLLKQIANATEIRVQLLGSEGSVEAYFMGGNFDNFQQFVRDYVGDT